MERNAERKFATRYGCELAIEVDRDAPRSAPGTRSSRGRPEPFATWRPQLPRIAKMEIRRPLSPPIHPIGTTFRKGRNNKVAAEKDDVGSPWAIGSAEGGHKAIHPQLGTIDDFKHLVAAARERGIEMALDIAFQASPDHPYVNEHEDWFQKRPDGTIQYAENPPKKYQDIYPFHFETDAWSISGKELCDVFRFWIDKGRAHFSRR